MRLAVIFSALSALAAVSAAPLSEGEKFTVPTLNYQGFSTPIWPPDGGCIIVARLYKKDGQLRVYDSAPVCVSEANAPKTYIYMYEDHSLQGLKQEDVIWAAYGWVFPKDDDENGFTSNIGCIWLDADLSKPCLREHELKPADLTFPSPWELGWWSEYWIIDREVKQVVKCTSRSECNAASLR